MKSYYCTLVFVMITSLYLLFMSLSKDSAQLLISSIVKLKEKAVYCCTSFIKNALVLGIK